MCCCISIVFPLLGWLVDLLFIVSYSYILHTVGSFVFATMGYEAMENRVTSQGVHYRLQHPEEHARDAQTSPYLQGVQK